jgi:hypothetical protein
MREPDRIVVSVAESLAWRQSGRQVREEGGELLLW